MDSEKGPTSWCGFEEIAEAIKALQRRDSMLARKVSAVLCSTDLTKSQEFYEQKVGLPGDDSQPRAIRVW
jgi:hypothetical protein